MHKDWYEGLISHLTERELSYEEIRMVDHILSSDRETLRREKLGGQQYEKTKLNTPNVSSDSELLKKEKSSVQPLQENNTASQVKNSYDKYPILRTISKIFRVLAWIVGVITAMTTIRAFFEGISLAIKRKDIDIFNVLDLYTSFYGVFLGGLMVLLLLAFSELIMVSIDIEYNTRHTKRSTN